MESNSNIRLKLPSDYQISKDWRFVSIFQFSKFYLIIVNLFKNVLALEHCSSIDLEVKTIKIRIALDILRLIHYV